MGMAYSSKLTDALAYSYPKANWQDFLVKMARSLRYPIIREWMNINVMPMRSDISIPCPTLSLPHPSPMYLSKSCGNVVSVPREQENPELRGKISHSWMMLAHHALTVQGRSEVVLSVLKTYNHAEHGGNWKDYLRFRRQGDTPIVLATALPALYSHLSKQRDSYTREELDVMETSLANLTAYVIGYHPVEANNHFAWKWLCIMMASAYFNQEWLYNHAVWMTAVLMSIQYKEGVAFLEMERGDKAWHYATMNLEALAIMHYLCRVSSDTFGSIIYSHKMNAPEEYQWVVNWVYTNTLGEKRNGQGIPLGSHLMIL